MPAAVQAEFGQLQHGTEAMAADLKRMVAAAAAHDANAARAAATALNQAFVQVANGITGLKQKGVR